MDFFGKLSLTKTMSWAFILLCSQPIIAEDILKGYTLGEGLRFRDIHLSGYATVEVEVPEDGKNEFFIDDLSLFGNARFNKFINPFFEVELTHIPLLIEDEALFSGKKPKVILERLYNDSHLTDQLTLRLGKSLTPIGQWNSIHAGPLVPTTKRPMTTYRSFSEYITGVSVIYQPRDEQLPTVTAYWQPDDGFSSNPKAIENREFHGVKGMSLSWDWGLANLLGLTFQQAGVHLIDGSHGESQYLVGANIHLAKNDFELQSEFTHTWIDNPHASRMRTNETGLFVQGLYNLSDSWALMSRYEYFADRDYVASSNNALFGVKYNPKTPIVWKLEYVKQWGQKLNIGSGLYASLAVLF